MNCCVTELRNKEVINKTDGQRLGNVCDVEVDTCSGKVVAIVIFGRYKCMGLMGRDEDIRICWEEIDVIGEDTILVCHTPCVCRRKGRKQRRFDGMF